MSLELVVRRAEIDDIGEFNSLISSLGRVPLFRAIFGAFNYSNIIEFSHLSLIATCGCDENSAVGFISITDSLNLDSLSFETAIHELRRYLPLQVREILSFDYVPLRLIGFSHFILSTSIEFTDNEHCLRQLLGG